MVEVVPGPRMKKETDQQFLSIDYGKQRLRQSHHIKFGGETQKKEYEIAMFECYNTN